MEIVDAHGHFGSLRQIAGGDLASEEIVDEERWEELEFQARVDTMRDLGIAWTVMQPSHGYLKPDGIKDTMRVNDSMAAYRQRDPVHFPVVAGTVEPNHGERSLAEIERAKFELHLDALSWHPRYSGVYLDNKWMWPILTKMSDLGLVPLVHANPESQLESPWRLQRLAKEFPKLTFVVFDAFLTLEGIQPALQLAEALPNTVWVVGPVFPGYRDGGVQGSWRLIENWIRDHGADQIAYGGALGYSSTSPAKSHRLLELITASPLSTEAKANILGGNIRRVFGR